MTRKWAALAAAILLGGCAHAAPETSPSQSGGGLAAHTLLSGGAERSYLAYTPARLSGPAPVVIMLHGGGGNSENGLTMSGFNALAAGEGFVAVYPEGTGRGRYKTWNAGHCCAYALQENVDDVGFISDLIDELVREGVADPDRVYVTGMSNGGMMSFRIGRELSHKVAAIAPVVGAMFGDEPQAATPVAALIMTGAQDIRVPPGGGNGSIGGLRRMPNDLPYAPAETAFTYWKTANGCTGEEETAQAEAYTLRAGAGCKAPALWYSLPEGTHSWPGGQKGSVIGDDPIDNLDASSVIWDFFSQQVLAR